MKEYCLDYPGSLNEPWYKTIEELVNAIVDLKSRNPVLYYDVKIAVRDGKYGKAKLIDKEKLGL